MKNKIVSGKEEPRVLELKRRKANFEKVSRIYHMNIDVAMSELSKLITEALNGFYGKDWDWVKLLETIKIITTLKKTVLFSYDNELTVDAKLLGLLNTSGEMLHGPASEFKDEFTKLKYVHQIGRIALLGELREKTKNLRVSNEKSKNEATLATIERTIKKLTLYDKLANGEEHSFFPKINDEPFKAGVQKLRDELKVKREELILEISKMTSGGWV